jgi:diketogulonate reductase-like aldo/keto reductase
LSTCSGCPATGGLQAFADTAAAILGRIDRSRAPGEQMTATASVRTRRHFLGLLGAAAGAGTCAGALGLALGPGRARAEDLLPSRPIPSTGERLPIVGLGSTRPVSEIGSLGTERVEAIVRALVEHGGRVVDTWPRDAANDGAFGRIVRQPDLRENLFVTINIDEPGEQGVAQFERTLALYDRGPIDLVNVGSLIDLDAHWPRLQRWKDEGRARYIGVTAARAELYDALEAFLARETPDFVEINYSATEREAESRFLPSLAERGIAVLISRPFMNGAYFERLENEPLPEWTAEFECESWAQFSLQYILANPELNCVLTETTNPAHMAENARTGLKPLPDAAARRRMRAWIDALA